MSDARPPLSFSERAFIKALIPLSNFSEGFWIDFGEEIVRTHGITGFFKWAKLTDDIRRELEADVGVMHHHLLGAFSSLLNGCDYCGFGNLYAFNLLWLKKHDELFPIAEFESRRLLRMSYDEFRAEIESALASEKYQKEREMLLRQFDLKLHRAKPEGKDDEVLLLSLRLYDFINECSIVTNAPAPPLGKVAKDKKLRKAYRETRPLPEHFADEEI
ncbi:MAG: hypothetical protein GY822_22245 [Deltaproteobacteria bacterium]|nr:hypothetical protein [Deltaproteobacteria bacterium]